MICHFQGGGRKVPVHQPVAVGQPSPDPGPLGFILARLIGREVTVLAGRRLHTGRLLQTAPVTLAGPDGRATVIAAPVISIQF